MSCALYFSATCDELGARVGRVRRHVGEKHFAHDQLVVAAADRIRANEHGLEHAVGAVAGRLIGARSVEAPDRRLLARLARSWSWSAASASARRRRSRCTRPCSSSRQTSLRPRTTRLVSWMFQVFSARRVRWQRGGQHPSGRRSPSAASRRLRALPRRRHARRMSANVCFSTLPNSTPTSTSPSLPTERCARSSPSTAPVRSAPPAEAAACGPTPTSARRCATPCGCRAP